MNKQQLESILNNAPEGMPQVHISEQFGVVYITVGGDDHNLSDLQTQLNLLNEIERLKSEKELACQTFAKAIEYALETDEGLKWLELWLDCSTYDELVGWGWEDTPKEAFNGLRVLKELNK